ncbi:MAG: aldo/keto reductase [Kiritimatiellae bacterium]|nr:aldo/keto reductase [Kiritimatiellia bacterium]
MQHATLGATGLRVSRLGFGAMRLPMDGDRVDRELAIPMIHRAFEAGVNYIDTAVGYCNQDSQRAVGEALQGWREKVIVSTKNPYYGDEEKEWWQNLENSLERLRVASIDIYNTHGIRGARFEEAVRPRIGKWLVKAKEQGLIKHICTSFHDTNEELRKIIDAGFYESITLQYNLLDRKLEDGMAYAAEKRVGIVVMGPVGGGRLGAPNRVLAGILPQITRMPELALRFVLSNPNVTIALSGMSTIEQVEENLRTAADPRTLNSDEQRLVAEQLDRLAKMADVYCTGCGYCVPCPNEVNIPKIFGLYNAARVYGLEAHARQRYAAWRGRAPRDGKAADACLACGVCEEKCPQRIAIRAQLKEAHALLASTPEPVGA